MIAGGRRGLLTRETLIDLELDAPGPLVLGTNSFGWTTDEREAFRILDRFVDAGGRIIDTADAYSQWAPGNGGGESERVIGSWLARRGRRDDVLIMTKVAVWTQRPGLAPHNIAQAIEGSLERLRTDYVDIYLAHRDDPQTPQVEYLSAFDSLVRAGQVRAIGVSGFEPQRIVHAAEITAREGFAPISVSSDLYNLVERGFESSNAPILRRYGIAEFPFYSLASGFLSGKYRPGSSGTERAVGAPARYLTRPEGLRVLAALDEIAARRSCSPGAIALAWLRSRQDVAAPIAGARSLDQMAGLIESFTIDLTADETAALDRASDRL